MIRMEQRIKSVTGDIEEHSRYASDLDQALVVAGIGWYNIKYCLVLALFLIAAIIEPVGYSFVLPAAICDLQMTNSQRGFISSIPYIGIVLMSFPWGYLVDTRGRKRMIIYSSLAAGTLGVSSGFMPNLISFTIFKFLTSLCIACPAAVPYTYIGEILPQQYRDITLSITNAMQISGSALVPQNLDNVAGVSEVLETIKRLTDLEEKDTIKTQNEYMEEISSLTVLAWGILPLDFKVDFGSYYFRAWRLLAIVYSSFFIIAAVLMCFAPESPKYLVSQGRRDEALKILRVIYARNKGKSPDEYPIKLLSDSDSGRSKGSFINSLKEQTVPLLKPPYLKWLALNGFLLFGILSVLNGLVMWVPDVLNRVLTGSGEDMTACDVIALRLNETASAPETECIDTIEPITFMINTIANVCCAVIALAVSSTVKFLGKKNLLIIIFLLIGTFCVLINFITENLIFAVLLSSLPVMGLGIGPVNAYAVEIFPTHLRGMAVSLTMMVGRMGSVIGTNVAGLLLDAACEATFYMFGGLLILCGFSSILLPRSNTAPPKTKKLVITRL